MMIDLPEHGGSIIMHLAIWVVNMHIKPTFFLFSCGVSCCNCKNPEKQNGQLHGSLVLKMGCPLRRGNRSWCPKKFPSLDCDNDCSRLLPWNSCSYLRMLIARYPQWLLLANHVFHAFLFSRMKYIHRNTSLLIPQFHFVLLQHASVSRVRNPSMLTRFRHHAVLTSTFSDSSYV